MKKVAVILALLCSVLLLGCARGNPGNDIKKEDDACIEIQTPPYTDSYEFNSYKELSEGLIQPDSFLKRDIAKDRDKYGGIYEKTITLFEKKAVDLWVPSYGGKLCTLRDAEGFNNITVFTVELYNLPWIWYFCKVQDKSFRVQIAYTCVLDSVKLDSARTYCEVLSVIAPDAPQPANYKEYKSYQKIYEKDLSLSNGKKLTAMVSEVKDSDTVYVMFKYDGLLVCITADFRILSDSFWSKFDLVRFN